MFTEIGLAGNEWIVVVLCALLVGFAKTGIGGVGIVVIPLMAMVFPAEKSPGILLPMLIMGDIFAVSYYHRHAVWTHLLRPMPWAIAGVLAGFAVMKFGNWTSAEYSRLIGGITLACVLLTVWRRRQARNDKRNGEQETGPEATDAGTKSDHEQEPTSTPAHIGVVIFTGLLGGFATMVANAAGPIWVIYLLAIGLPKFELVGTGAWFFIILNVFKVPFQINLGNITGPTFMFNLVMLPAILIGAWAGVKTLKRIDQKLFNNVIQWLAAAAAVKLLLS